MPTAVRALACTAVCWRREKSPYRATLEISRIAWAQSRKRFSHRRRRWLHPPSQAALRAPWHIFNTEAQSPMQASGKAWKFPQNDINTDQIRLMMYAHLPLAEQARHCLETLDARFAAEMNPGEILVAGQDFGWGSAG